MLDVLEAAAVVAAAEVPLADNTAVGRALVVGGGEDEIGAERRHSVSTKERHRLRPMYANWIPVAACERKKMVGAEDKIQGILLR